jgi:peroxiredoxin
VELQAVVPALSGNDVPVFAISYDSVEILARFAEKHGIAFPLLSDQGSHVMRRLGLLNPRVQEDHAAYGIAPNPRHVDLPYPGVFLLDEQGVVVVKRFHESYRERDTGAGLLAHTLDLVAAAPGPDVAVPDEAIHVRAWLDSPTYCMFQRLHLNVEITVADGFHVYGEPIPGGYTPLSVDVAPIDGMERGAIRWPVPRRFTIDGLAEEFWVHEGTIRGSLPLTFTAAPGAGDHVLHATVAYQACSRVACLPPSVLRLEFPVKEVALVDRELPTKTGKTAAG